MILDLYILLAIVGFMFLLLGVFINKDVVNVYIWAIAIVIFGALFFASYNIQTATTVIDQENVTTINSTHSVTDFSYETVNTNFQQPGVSWLFLGLSLLSVILFITDLFNHAKRYTKKV